MLRGAPWLLVVLALGCARPVRIDRREAPVEAGLDVPFLSHAVLRWDFGDGTPPTRGAQVTHAFAKAGRYEVRGFEGEALREQVSVLVVPRAPFHLVPPDVQWAVIARGLEELPPVIDFAERLSGPERMQAWLEQYPLHGWALDQASAGTQWVDPREGLAFFAWGDGGDDVRLSVVGVTEGAGALAAVKAWLTDRGWTAVSEVQGLQRMELDARALDLFVDRGALYAVDAPLTGRQPGVQQRIAAASALGLEADGPTAAALDALPSGGLVLWLRGPEGAGWKQLGGTLRLTKDEAHFEARLLGAGPLWAVPESSAARLLSRAPEAPIAVGVASIEPRQLAALLLGAPGTQRRNILERELQAQGAELDRALAGLAGTFDASMYFDVEGFVRSTLAAGGRPQPQGTLLVEAAVKDAAAVEALIDALLRRWGLTLTRSHEQQLRLWRGDVAGRAIDLALTERGLFVKLGSSVGGREPVDLSRELAARFDGAFGPGHVSVLFDFGQLRQELLLPRLMKDVDPRQALTAQALAATLLDRLTQLDLAVIDLSPTPEGAALQAVIRLRN